MATVWCSCREKWFWIQMETSYCWRTGVSLSQWWSSTQTRGSRPCLNGKRSVCVCQGFWVSVRFGMFYEENSEFFLMENTSCGNWYICIIMMIYWASFYKKTNKKVSWNALLHKWNLLKKKKKKTQSLNWNID